MRNIYTNFVGKFWNYRNFSVIDGCDTDGN